MANQVDLDASSNPKAPVFDASNGFNAIHVPNGSNRNSRADTIPGTVAGVSPLKVTIAPTGAFVRFCNPA